MMSFASLFSANGTRVENRKLEINFASGHHWTRGSMSLRNEDMISIEHHCIKVPDLRLPN